MPTKNAYTEKRTALDNLLAGHNKALGAKSPDKLDTKAITAVLLKEGGTNEAGLKAFTRQDYIDFGFPRALASQAVELMNGVTAAAPTGEASKKAKKASSSSSPGIMMLHTQADAVKAMSVFDLVKGLDINNPGLIGEELIERARRVARPGNADDAARGRPFVFYTDATGTKVARKVSAEYLQAALDGTPVTDTVMIGGEPIEPMRVGERPNVFHAENPLYRGRALRMPGYVCDVTNEAYGTPGEEGSVSFEVQQLLAVASTVLPGAGSPELRISDPEVARAIIVTARTPNALSTFKGRYPKSAAALRNMTPGEKPTLQLKQVAGGGARPPFGK